MLWSSSPTAMTLLSPGTNRPSTVRPDEHLDPGVLEPVGILEFVDQDVAEARW
jgi:hypothetical protein